MIEGLRLQDPIWLLLLAVVFAVTLIATNRASRHAVLYSSLDGLRDLPKTIAQRVKATLPWVRFLGLGCVVVALTRPQLGREEFRIRTEGIAIQLVIDRSGSMEALDFFDEDGKRQDRLEIVKSVIKDFVSGKGDLPGRPDDRIGLVVFGGFAESKCPLTLDHGALLSIIDTVEIPREIIDSKGRVINEEILQEERATAIGDALALGVERVKDIDVKSRVLVLLSDGENTAGIISPLEAAQAAKTFGVKVYTIGVGTTGTAPVRATDPFGQEVLISQRVRLDEEGLRAIAEVTGGQYYNARDTESLKNVYAMIDELEKTPTEGLLYTEYRELFATPLLLGAALVVLERLLSCTRFRTLP